MKKWMKISLWVLLGISLLTLLIYSVNRHDEAIVTQAQFDITYPENAKAIFIDAEELLDLLEEENGLLHGKRLNEVKAHQLEDFLEEIPWVEQAEVYYHLNGSIQAKVVQKDVKFKVFDKHENCFYVGTDGSLIPLHDRHSAQVLIVNGFVNENLKSLYEKGLNVVDLPDSLLLKKINSLCDAVLSDPFFSNLIAQVYISPELEFELIPRLGFYVIEFGGIEDLNEKLLNLKVFYRQAGKKRDINKYKTLNLRYRNQVICTKK